MQTFLALIIVMVSVADISLEPCPSSPNCVSSQATDSHFIKSLPINGEAKVAFDGLKVILERRSDTTIVAADDKEIRVEFKTALGFVDDGLFVLDAENRVIHVRSASRAGYWDFGKNRRRLEKIRKEFLSQAG
jgi:uncharacterized protein (DUF1499 family)